VPLAVVVIATVAMLGAFGMFALTLVQNSFASRTIELFCLARKYNRRK
jgi:hypothetical protein